ncbi:MAG: hypothetical protein BWY19_00888 [bacterium ADurb.Bin212]|nr:MAG: hypothetical protein BWY19_00888 [bacterium ADurb.Bin212]
MIQSYKDLVVWQKAVSLVEAVYRSTESFPKEEVFGLISQMRRSAISIPSNIAEGSSRGTRKDYCQFLRISLGSCSELETQVIIAEKLKFMDFSKSAKLLQQLNEIMKILNTIIKKL